MVSLNLAYKYVAMMLMVAEVNFFCDQTGLKTERPYAEQDVRNGSHVGPYNPKDFGGSILTDQYRFGFGWGHLGTFGKRGFMPENSSKGVHRRILELSQFSSLIDTNEAYRIATNWLGALGVDIKRLEGKYRLNILQTRNYPDGNRERKAIMLPVYYVEWRGFILRSQPKHESAVVRVTVFGATKELVDYLVLDDSLFLRPRIGIKDAEKLLAIPDEEFRSFDSAQRRNLVMQFAAKGKIQPNFSFAANLDTNATNAAVQEKIPKVLPLESKTNLLPINREKPSGGIKAPARPQTASGQIHKLAPLPQNEK